MIVTGGGDLLLGLEVVQENGAFLRFLAPVAHDDATAVDDFAGVAFAVEDACMERNVQSVPFGASTGSTWRRASIGRGGGI